MIERAPETIIASSVHDIPLYPPLDWFTPPDEISTDKRLTVTETGRVYGYIALWDSCHVGLEGCVKPPQGSPSDYSYAHVGETILDTGDTLKTAVIAGGIPHPGTNLPVDDIPNIYANTGKQYMRVCYGEDDNGLWFAGALFPSIDEHDLATLRASALSGDWRWHVQTRHGNDGAYDFSGAIMVNIPGYRIEADSIGAGQSKTVYASAVQEQARHGMASQGVITASGQQWQLAVDQNTIHVGGVLLVEGVQTEDGRMIQEGATEFRDPPLPLYASLENTMGHEGADLVGRIDTLTRDENKIVYTATVFVDSARGAGAETIEAIANGMLTGISVDGISGPDDMVITDEDVMVFEKFVIAGATLTPLPAMKDTTVSIQANATHTDDQITITAGGDCDGNCEPCDCGGKKAIKAQAEGDAPAPDGVPTEDVATDAPANVAVEEAADTEGAVTLEKVADLVREVLGRIDVLEDELVMGPKLNDLADELRDE